VEYPGERNSGCTEDDMNDPCEGHGSKAMDCGSGETLGSAGGQAGLTVVIEISGEGNMQAAE